LARQIGYSQKEIEALADLERTELFPPEVKMALLYASQVTRDAHTVTDKFFAELKRYYSDSQILELTSVIGLSTYFNKFTTALRVDLSGTDEPYDAPAKAGEGA